MIIHSAYANSSVVVTEEASQGGIFSSITDFGSSSGGFDFMSFAPMVLVVIVFYFLLIRPQQKRNKRHKKMVEAIKNGDIVLTQGGVVGRVKRIDTERNLLFIETAKCSESYVARHMIADVNPASLEGISLTAASSVSVKKTSPARKTAPAKKAVAKKSTIKKAASKKS